MRCHLNISVVPDGTYIIAIAYSTPWTVSRAIIIRPPLADFSKPKIDQ